MASKQRNPAAWGADRARNAICLAAIDFENNPHPLTLQHRRAHWLARRFRLPLTMARVDADLHFGGVAR